MKILVISRKYLTVIVILITIFSALPGISRASSYIEETGDIAGISYPKYVLASVSGLVKDLFKKKKKSPETERSQSVSTTESKKEKTKEEGKIIYSYDRKELEKMIGEEKQKLREDLSRYEGQAKEAFDLAKQAEGKYGQLKKDLESVKSSGLKVDGTETLKSEILGLKNEAENILKTISSGKKEQLSGNNNSEIAVLRAEMQNINTNLINKINILSTQTSNQTSAVYRTISLTNKIDNLSNVAISNATVSGISGLTDSDIPDGLTASNYLPLSGGALTGTLTVNANILQQASSYLNFGAIEGTAGYGLRDNTGMIQIKNSGGNWVNISTASTTIVNQHASGGAGTEASPWTGWESAINNLAVNSEIFFPAGYYRISSPIITKAGWRISGAGVDSTRIILDSGMNDSIFKSASDPVTGSYVWNLTIQDLYLDGNKANNSSGKGVYGSFWHLKIYRTKFKNFAENGINLIAGGAGEIWENFLIDVYVEASGGDNVKIETGVNDGEIIRLVSRDSAANGIHLNSVGGWKITNSHFYYNQVGVRLKDSSKTTVNNSEIETNKTIGLQINGSGGNQVVGNSFYRNSCPTIASNVCSGYGSYSHVTVEWSNNNGLVGNNFYKYSSEPNFTKYIIEEQGTSNSNYVSDNTYIGYATGDFLKVGANSVFTSNFNGVTNSVRGIFSDIGIGTTSPAAQLEVASSTGGIMYLSNSDTTLNQGDMLGALDFKAYDISSNGTKVKSFLRSYAETTFTGGDHKAYLSLGTSNGTNDGTEALRITGDANVGIGTTSPQRRLHVYRSDDGAPVRFEDSNGYCEIDPTSTSWTCTSDRTLKKDISNMTAADSLSKLSQLQAVSFRWLNQDTADLRYGFIAQDVESVLPDFVRTDERGIKTINYGGFTPVMIDAIKELNIKISDLAAASTASSGTASDSLFSWIIGKFLGIGVDFSQDKIKVKNICVGEICVSEEQFREVFGGSSSSVFVSSSSSESSISSSSLSSESVSSSVSSGSSSEAQVSSSSSVSSEEGFNSSSSSEF